MPNELIEKAGAALGIRLAHSGDLNLLNSRRRALLVSRGARRPDPLAPWVTQTAAATKLLLAQGEVLVTSAGRTAYDVALFACFKARGSAIVVLESPPTPDDEWRKYLPRHHLLIHPVEPPDPETAASRRDLLIGCFADCAYAIHMRDAGNMAKTAGLMFRQGALLEPFHMPPAAQKAPPPKNDKIHIPEGSALDESAWDYLTHFTREPDGPWPGEERAEYLEWLCAGGDSAPRDSFATLCRILREGKIRACGRLMPGLAPMVCFTALSPAATSRLRVWRRGLLRWSFTPYGLAIKSGARDELGANPVRYASATEIRNAPPGERRYMQRERSGQLDWTRENEWRAAGDVNLSRIPRGKLLALVETPAQLQHIQDTFGIAAAIAAPGRRPDAV